MNCPRCKAPMLVVEYEGVELDTCLECEGTWFDRDELELLFEELSAEAQGLLPREMQSLPEAQTRERKRRCPACGRKMRKVLIGPGQDILIDVCPQGDGLWFDSKEVAQLAREAIDAVPGLAGKAIHFMGQVFRSQESPDKEGPA